MDQMKRVAILGAGALGAYYASCFFATGFTTVFAASGHRAQALREQGVKINGERLILPVLTPDEQAHPVDLIIVALKHHQLAEALADIGQMVGSETIILSVLNGLDSETVIADMYGADKVLYCVAIGIDAVRQGNEVIVANQGKLYLGEASNLPVSSRVRKVQQALDHAGLKWETPDDMLRIMWWKFMMNVGVNQASAVLRAPYRVFQQSKAGQSVLTMLMQEVITLAKAAGINLTETDLDQWAPILAKLAPEAKTSMLQDIEAGRKTEVEIFAGKVVTLGEKYHIPTPVNAMMLQMIRTLEEGLL